MSSLGSNEHRRRRGLEWGWLGGSFMDVNDDTDDMDDDESGLGRGGDDGVGA